MICDERTDLHSLWYRGRVRGKAFRRLGCGVDEIEFRFYSHIRERVIL